ncbi:NADH dehydrogenase subunit C [Methylobacillus rhizosphaerae]|uniref:NADH-quinone oxidoreductase subunit C n=1 Tax=Methylobacillus rhizosphaerae TaxID=551994 RepID=A0A239AMJ6_9PROT|nr:NADH dehydrogenase subunit C [Methylobacillus rhizosphaerae]
MTRLEQLKQHLQEVLGDSIVRMDEAVGELSIECKPACLLEVCNLLRDHKLLKFEQLIDLCGMDYVDHGEGTWSGSRYATVYHLLSVSLNQRLRLRVFAADDDFPVLPTVVDLWPVANWFERESFDLFGIMYEGHPDLRRLLTDYGFVGHPFRKDFPMIGNVEMRYDPEQQRVVYQPVTIDPRNNVPRVIREEGFHHG